MTALRNSRCNHEARRLHTDRTLRFLIGRKGGRLSVNDLDDVAPFDDGAGVIQVLDVTTLLLLCRLYPPLSNSNLSFRSGWRGLLQGTTYLLERSQDELEGSLDVLFFGERSCIGGEAAITAGSGILPTIGDNLFIFIRIIVRLKAK